MSMFTNFSGLFNKNESAENVSSPRFVDALETLEAVSEAGSSTDVPVSPVAESSPSDVNNGFPGATRFQRSRTTGMGRLNRADTSSWDEALKSSPSSRDSSRPRIIKPDLSNAAPVPNHSSGADTNDWRKTSQSSFARGNSGRRFEFTGANAGFVSYDRTDSSMSRQSSPPRHGGMMLERQSTSNFSATLPTPDMSKGSILGMPPVDTPRYVPGTWSDRSSTSSTRSLERARKPAFNRQGSLLGDCPGANNGILGEEVPLPAALSRVFSKPKFVRNATMEMPRFARSESASLGELPEGLIKMGDSVSSMCAPVPKPKLTLKMSSKPVVQRSGSSTYANNAGLGLPYATSLPRVAEHSVRTPLPLVRRASDEESQTSKNRSASSSVERSEKSPSGPLGPDGTNGFSRVRTATAPILVAA